MSFSIDTTKSKAKNLVCKNYISIDDDGDFSFNSFLKFAIERREITKDDALLISLELMHRIFNKNVDYTNVKDDLKNLISFVKKYNRRNKNINNHLNIFLKDYDNEKKILFEYIEELYADRNDSSLNNIRNYKPNEIKTCLNHLSRKDLCYILNINPELNFDKEKILKNQIANEFSKYPLDLNKISNSSAENIKKYFNSLCTGSNKEEKNRLPFKIEKRMNKLEENIRIQLKNNIKEEKKQKRKNNNGCKEVSDKSKDKIYSINKKDFKKSDNHLKIKFNKLLLKVREFNQKDLQDMIMSRHLYSETYDEVKNFDYGGFKKNEDVKKFIYYFSHVDEVKYSFKLFNKIKKQNLFDTFLSRVKFDDYLSISKRKKLLNDFNDFYDLVNKTNDLVDYLKNKITDNFPDLDYFIECYEDLKEYSSLKNTNKKNHIKKINDYYINEEIEDNKDFFKDIKDSNKKKAIVCDEDNIKVVAGAGAGKTFIIQKKVNYLIEKRNVDSEKILCLCYTKKSVDQLNREINKNGTNNNVKVFTFHEFARRVIRDCERKIKSNRYLLDEMIRKYVWDIVNDSNKLSKLSEYFSYYSFPQFDDKFRSMDEYEEYCEGNKIRSLKKRYYQCRDDIETIKGEYVKSIGELLIANYLFLHDIEYQYEKHYPFNYYADIIEERFLYSGNFLSLNPIYFNLTNEEIIRNYVEWERNKDYRPDFYLPKYDIYLEHFGVDKNMEATFLEGEAKAKYERDMKYKRIEHKIYGTKLIETYFYYLTEDRLLKELEEKLPDYVNIGHVDQEKIIDLLIKSKRVDDFDNFSKLVKSFINIYESKYINKIDFNEFRKNNNDTTDIYNKNRQNLFFNIVEEIYNNYYDENTKGTLSHNHEIIKALKLIQNREFKKDYDYIFIDEYQDINPVRCKLLQELQKNSKSKMFVVGDDWQSIYGFSGSEVGLFINFDKYFENPETFVIEENRRNPQKLIDISSEFVTNKGNLDKKKLTYYKDEKNPNIEPIKIVKYSKKNIKKELEKCDKEDLAKKRIELEKKNRKSKILKFESVIEYIIRHSIKDNPEILILGRNNDDIDDYVGNILFIEKDYGKHRKIIYSKNKSLPITFMTVHQSKGLQKDEVIVLNLEDRYGGFPNKMVDDPILSFVKDNENQDFAEERRLFYVALTRTKNNVFLFTPLKSSSIFVKELINEFGINTKGSDFGYISSKKFLFQENDFFQHRIPFETNIVCPECGKGVITVILNYYNKEGKRTKYVRCNSCNFDFGPYPASLEDVEYVKKCPKCRGVLVRQGDMLRCCLNYHEGCDVEEELKLDDEELKFDYD